MDKKIEEKLNEKITETFSKKEELKNLLFYLDVEKDQKSIFSFGFLIGRLYNSFYYQTRRILNRDPTQQEFDEFSIFLKENANKLIESL